MRQLSLLFAACVLLSLAAATASAQTPKFKEGDRVEVETNGAGFNSRFAHVQRGTIVQVDTQLGMRYFIQLDPVNGYTPSKITIPIYSQDDRLRLITTAAPAKPAGNNGGGENANDGAGGANEKTDTPDDGKAKYKVGDRVEVETAHAGFNSPYAIVSKGTITEADTAQWMRYVIQLDPLPGKLPVMHSIPIADEDCCLRPLAGAAPTIKTEPLRVDENGTVLADRPLLDCDNLQHGGRNGQPLPVELAKKLIRCLYEKPSPVGQDGATKMDIVEFTPGAPRKWILYQDQGQGTLGTIVYPVHVKYNVKTFYRGRNAVVTGKEMTFTCFADKQNLWQCGFASGPNKEGKKEDILVKPPSR